MPGRNPAAAFSAFIEPLQRDISCLTNDVLIVSPGGRHTSARIHSLTLANGPIPICDGLHLHLGLQYDIIRTEDPDKGPYKVRTQAYDYALRDDDGRTQVSFHWHPLGVSTHKDPHFHIPPHWEGIHFPCERTSIESVVRMCIREFGARPNRDDWEDVLMLNESVFMLHRSWWTQPDLAKERG